MFRYSQKSTKKYLCGQPSKMLVRNTPLSSALALAHRLCGGAPRLFQYQLALLITDMVFRLSAVSSGSDSGLHGPRRLLVREQYHATKGLYSPWIVKRRVFPFDAFPGRQKLGFYLSNPILTRKLAYWVSLTLPIYCMSGLS